MYALVSMQLYRHAPQRGREGFREEAGFRTTRGYQCGWSREARLSNRSNSLSHDQCIGTELIVLDADWSAPLILLGGGMCMR